MTLIQGTVEYTTPRPFDSASARVSLSFAFVEGEDPNAQISRVAAMAEAHARHIIAVPIHMLANTLGGAMSTAPGTVPGAPIAVPPATPLVSSTGLSGAEPSPTVAAAPPEVAVLAPPPEVAVLAPPPASSVVQLLGQPSAPTTGTASLPGGAPSTPASPGGISDTDLVTAITHRNAALLPIYGEGSAQKICDLVAEFVSPPAKAYAIPATQRQAFLDRLAALA